MHMSRCRYSTLWEALGNTKGNEKRETTRNTDKTSESGTDAGLRDSDRVRTPQEIKPVFPTPRLHKSKSVAFAEAKIASAMSAGKGACGSKRYEN